jgi:hypothetical protein
MKAKVDEYSHWNFAEEFTGREAAHLIAGCDPSSSEKDIDNKVFPVIKRLKKAYQDATKNFASMSRGFYSSFSVTNTAVIFIFKNLEDIILGPDQILSLEMENLIEEYNYLYSKLDVGSYIAHHSSDEVEELPIPPGRRYTDNIQFGNEIIKLIVKWADTHTHEFDNQKFSRVQLNRWLRENNFPSHYTFSTDSVSEKVLRSNERNTLLILIGALCKSLKLQYEPMDHNTVGKVMLLVQQLGIHMSDPTIRSKLLQISAAVDHKKNSSTF